MDSVLVDYPALTELSNEILSFMQENDKVSNPRIPPGYSLEDLPHFSAFNFDADVKI